MIQDKSKTFLFSLVGIVTQIFVSCCVYLLMFAGFLKVTLGINLLTGLFEFLKQFGSGYGAITNKPHLFVCAVLIASTLSLVNSIKSRAGNNDVFANAFEGAISVMTLMWLP